MKTIQKALNFVFNVAFYALFAAVMAVLVLFVFGVKPYITMSGSMSPAIQTGSVCFVDTNADYNNIQEGDIIAFEVATKELVTHRVISVSEEGLETKGDANGMSDGISTTAENFHGKTLFSVPLVGYVIKYMQEPAVMIIAFILVAGSLALNLVEAEEGLKTMNAGSRYVDADYQNSDDATVSEDK